MSLVSQLESFLAARERQAKSEFTKAGHRRLRGRNSHASANAFVANDRTEPGDTSLAGSSPQPSTSNSIALSGGTVPSNNSTALSGGTDPSLFAAGTKQPGDNAILAGANLTPSPINSDVSAGDANEPSLEKLNASFAVAAPMRRRRATSSANQCNSDAEANPKPKRRRGKVQANSEPQAVCLDSSASACIQDAVVPTKPKRRRGKVPVNSESDAVCADSIDNSMQDNLLPCTGWSAEMNELMALGPAPPSVQPVRQYFAALSVERRAQEAAQLKKLN